MIVILAIIIYFSQKDFKKPNFLANLLPRDPPQASQTALFPDQSPHHLHIMCIIQRSPLDEQFLRLHPYQFLPLAIKSPALAAQNLLGEEQKARPSCLLRKYRDFNRAAGRDHNRGN